MADGFRTRALGRWWRRRGLRSRVTITAAAGLAVAFIAADLLLFGALRITLTRSVDDSARQAADQIVALINSQPLPQPVPVTASTVAIQVVSPDGRIIDGSAAADRMVPLLSPAQAVASARTGQAITVQGAPYDLPPVPLSVVAASAANGDIVIAAVPYSAASASLSVVERALVFGTPLLFILFTGAIWLAVGSTLRPIALLRRGAATVSVTGVPRALPVPVAQDEVRSLALTLNDMLGRLALAQQRQRDLVSDTAHELRSPIASIRAQLEVALDHPSGQDWATTTRDVHADVLRLARLAEDLLVLARLDERAIAPRDGGARDDGGGDGSGGRGSGGHGSGGHGSGGDGASWGGFTDLAEVSVEVARRYGSARVPVVVDVPGVADVSDGVNVPGEFDVPEGVDVPGGVDMSGGVDVPGAADDHSNPGEADVPRETVPQSDIAPCMVIGARNGVDRALVNLIDNAVRYAASRVTVSVRCADGWGEVSVTDDGPGIPEADRERAFGRFTRLDDARSRDGEDSGGAGLGLAIVRATAQAYGGAAYLEAAAPDGLCAVLRLTRPRETEPM